MKTCPSARVDSQIDIRELKPFVPESVCGRAAPQRLENLSVARARGGTVFRVTPEQWSQVEAAAGGWDDRWWHAHDTVPVIGRLGRSRGQGRGLTAVERKVVEDYAMRRAIDYFRARQIPHRDVSAHESYDLHCDYADRAVFVEVKGTTSLGRIHPAHVQ